MTPPGKSSATEPIPEVPDLGPALRTDSEPVALKPDSVTELTLVLVGVPGERETETVELFPSLYEARPLPTVSPPALSRGPGGRSLVFFSEPASPSNRSGAADENLVTATRSTSFFVHFPNSKVFRTQPKQLLHLEGVLELIIPEAGADFAPTHPSFAAEPLLFYVRRGGSLSVLPEPARAAHDSSRPKPKPDPENDDFTRSSGELGRPPVTSETPACNSV